MLRMIDMARTPEEKEESAELTMATMPSPDSMPTYPYGLCLSLGSDEMEKLGLDGDCQVGDLLHFTAMAKVTSVSMSDSEFSGPDCRIEMQIQQMGVPEDESTETPDPTPGQLSRPKRYGA